MILVPREKSSPDGLPHETSQDLDLVIQRKPCLDRREGDLWAYLHLSLRLLRHSAEGFWMQTMLAPVSKNVTNVVRVPNDLLDV